MPGPHPPILISLIRLGPVLLAPAVALALVGCVAKGRPDARVAPVVQRPVPATQPETADAAEPEDLGRPVEGLIGHVAGQPLYAHRVLDGLEDELRAIGQRETRAGFRNRATELIRRRLASLVIDALVLQEAERVLTVGEREGLRQLIEFQREELLRRYGQGSIALAQRNIVEQTGTRLDRSLQDFRESVLIRTYLDRKIDPLVNVSRRDIARYYRDNYTSFNPPAERDVRLLWARDAADAEAIRDRLNAGEAFAEIAAEPLNQYPGKAAVYPIEGEVMFGFDAIDAAVSELDQGQWVGPIEQQGRYWFVQLDRLTGEDGTTLMDAQAQIERTLRDDQGRRLREDFFDRLRTAGSFTDERAMTEAVLQIATSKYAAAP